MRGRAMEAEIAEQPAVLAENSERYRDELQRMIGELEVEMVLIAARGSSDHAGLYARYLFEIHAGVPVSLAAPSVITRYGARMRYPRCLAIGISQSGAAPDVAEVLANLREEGHATLGITNTAESRLAQVAEHVLLLGAGPEVSVAATKTYTASLLALYRAAQTMGCGLGEPVLPDRAWLEHSRKAAEEALGPVLRARTVFALARGFGFATAQECALKLMECALLPCKAYSTADFEHGPRALATHGSAAVIFGHDAAPEGLAEQGCEVVLAPRAPAPEACAPLWDALFLQWLALTAGRVRGLDPDEPDHLEKVTETL
jgi:glutamine---fructose-6-phosphate transaminase (isomerizing)